MKKQTISLLLVILVFSLSCQFLSPPAREGTTISDCSDIVTSVHNIQPADIPQSLYETGIKQGDEFDANEYFNVFTHLSMQDGYLLDYVYPIADLGGSPILYARPEEQPSYASMKDIPENTDLADFHDYIEIEDVEQGYFEYVVMDIMAGQFYLFWHANYNDTQIVCSRSVVNAIISDINDGSFGSTFDISQETKARAMQNIEPLVQLTKTTATVEAIIFTKWGGFYRQTYTISRSFPHTIIDVKSENLVPYDCGVMF
jgi:hypothetical protein